MLLNEIREFINQSNPKENDPDMIMMLINENTLIPFLLDLIDDEGISQERKQLIIDEAYTACVRKLQGYIVGKRTLKRDDKAYQERYDINSSARLVEVLNEADMLDMYLIPMKYTTKIPEEQKMEIESSVLRYCFRTLTIDNLNKEESESPGNAEALTVEPAPTTSNPVVKPVTRSSRLKFSPDYGEAFSSTNPAVDTGEPKSNTSYSIKITDVGKVTNPGITGLQSPSEDYLDKKKPGAEDFFKSPDDDL